MMKIYGCYVWRVRERVEIDKLEVVPQYDWRLVYFAPGKRSLAECVHMSLMNVTGKVVVGVGKGDKMEVEYFNGRDEMRRYLNQVGGFNVLSR